jgi:hypothetical protein
MTTAYEPSVIAAIPTIYRGIQFRSRLEAKWAVFFDSLSWEWSYEPIDLDGYIPDFLLHFKSPLLVEVKPSITIDELQRHVGKVERSGWGGEAIMLGIGPIDVGDGDWPTLGLLAERDDEPDSGGGAWCWGRAAMHTCLCCRQTSFHHVTLCFRCRVSNCYDGDGYLGSVDPRVDIAGKWAAACNLVQWQAKR